MSRTDLVEILDQHRMTPITAGAVPGKGSHNPFVNGYRCECGERAGYPFTPRDAEGQLVHSDWHTGHLAGLIAELQASLLATDRIRLANEAYERGDIGEPDSITVWDWLLSESAATATPKIRITA